MGNEQFLEACEYRVEGFRSVSRYTWSDARGQRFKEWLERKEDKNVTITNRLLKETGKLSM